MENKFRIVSLDIAKGIGILLVVIGHCYSKYTKIEEIIYGCHMPLFFIISGVIYGKRNKEFSFNFNKKIKNLIVPFLFFEFMWFFILMIMNIKNPTWNGKDILIKIISFRGNIATWYLPCLFLTEFYFWICLKMNKPKIALTLLFIFGLILPNKFNGTLLVFLRPLVALGFFGIGYFGFNYFKVSINKVLIFILAIVYVIVTLKNGYILFYVRQFNNILLFIFTSIVGTYLVLQSSDFIAQKANNSKLLKKISSQLCYFGENSLSIMCIHMFLIEIIRMLDYKFFGEILPSFGEFEGLILGLFVFCCCLLIIPVLNKYFWFLVGKKKNLN